jgi:hypothetical protein
MDQAVSEENDELIHIWVQRGLTTLFGFAVATLLAAIITFIAHNWVYLSAAMKLGGLGALLVGAAIFWIFRKLDGQVAASFGIGAQVLIGVWLAAAGQIFQAPGGLQDLALNWAILGLPFALASRSWAHWAVWLGVVTLACVSPVGLMLHDWLGEDRDFVRFAIGGVALGAAVIIAILRQARGWSVTLASLASTLCLVVFGVNGLFRQELFSIVSILLLSGFGFFAYTHSKRAAPSLYATGAVLLVAVFLLWKFFEHVDIDLTLSILVTVLITGSGTFALVRIFQAILKNDPSEPDDLSDDMMEDDAGTPWYMDLLIAIGGFVTALLGVGFIGSFLGLIAVLTGREDIAIAVFGALIYGSAIIFRRRKVGLYLRVLLNTLVLMGGAALIAGLSMALGGFPNLALCLLLLILPLLTAVLVPKDRILHLVLAGAWMSGFGLLLDWIGLQQDLITLLCVATFSLIGVGFGMETLAGRRRTLMALVFLLAAMMAGIANDLDLFQVEWAALPRFVDVATLALGMGWMIMRLGRRHLPSGLVLGVLCLIAAVQPLGAAPALLLLLLGYSLRSTALFGLGVAAMAYFLFATYYDLSLTLVQLSGALIVTGLALLGLWVVAKRRVEIAA